MSVLENPRHILVVANETAVSKALVDLIEEKAKGGAVRVTVIAPVTQPRQGYVVYYDTRRAAARRRLDKTLDLLHEAGVHANGVVVETDPVSALRDAIDQRVNPLELIRAPQLQLLIPVKASNGSIKAHVKDVRAEVLDGSLRMHITYEFSGTRGQQG